MIRGTSSAADCSALTMAVHCAARALETSLWCEWVPSDANPADPFSRDGWASAFARDAPGLRRIDLVSAEEFIWEDILQRRWKAIWQYYQRVLVS